MEIWQFDLRRGNSNDPRHGACLLDAVSWFEYGTLGDHPPCVCPIYAAFGRVANDLLPDVRRQELKPLIFRLPGTVDPASERERAEFLMWQAIRVFAPLALEAAARANPAHAIELYDHASRLRDQRDANTATRTAEAAAKAAGAAAAAWAAKATDVARAATRAARAAGAAVWADRAAAGAAAWAAETAAGAAAGAVCAAKSATEKDAVYDSVIAALDGVLKIGKQAPPIEADAIKRANRTFVLARDKAH